MLVNVCSICENILCVTQLLEYNSVRIYFVFGYNLNFQNLTSKELELYSKYGCRRYRTYLDASLESVVRVV